ncbi:MAG TPA: ABC-2 family transporter protein [Chloroflexota bacterium]|nr:ABC-2 family transporter protein [Chloroflexota bacterium]
MSRHLKKYLAVLSITAQSGLAYPLDTFARCGFMAMVLFVFAQLWTATFQLSGRPLVGGFDLPRMIWYLVLTETIIMSCPRVFTKIDQEVKNGDLAYTLNRPYNYALFQYAAYLGNAALVLPINFLVGGALAYLLAGPPRVPLAAWPAIALCAVLAISLNFVVELVIGLLAFWFEDTYAFFWIYQKTIFTLGGLFLPLDLFPETLRKIAENLPFTAIAYAPARLTARFDEGLFLSTLAEQLLWLLLLGGAAALIYRGGARRLNVNGG